jgi:Flp pilus assembly protein TadG
VEFALLLPLLALLVFGTIDLGRAYRLNIRLEAAAREAAGFAQTQPNEVVCAGPFNDIGDFAVAEDPDLASYPGFEWRVFGNDGGELASTCRSSSPLLPAQVTSGQKVRVQVGATFSVLTPLVSNIVGSEITMTASASVRAQ